LGHIYLQEHQFKAAKEMYQRAIELDDGTAECHFFLGVVFRKTRKLRQALVALRRAVFLEPTFWQASYLLAATAKRLGEIQLSRSEFRRTIGLIELQTGTIPFITHPQFHTQFIDPSDVVLQASRQALAKESTP